jgi:Ca2+/H+ antiporter
MNRKDITMKTKREIFWEEYDAETKDKKKNKWKDEEPKMKCIFDTEGYVD